MNSRNSVTASGWVNTTQMSGTSARASQRGVVQNCSRSSARIPKMTMGMTTTVEIT